MCSGRRHLGNWPNNQLLLFEHIAIWHLFWLTARCVLWWLGLLLLGCKVGHLLITGLVSLSPLLPFHMCRCPWAWHWTPGSPSHRGCTSQCVFNDWLNALIKWGQLRPEGPEPMPYQMQIIEIRFPEQVTCAQFVSEMEQQCSNNPRLLYWAKHGLQGSASMFIYCMSPHTTTGTYFKYNGESLFNGTTDNCCIVSENHKSISDYN